MKLSFLDFKTLWVNKVKLIRVAACNADYYSFVLSVETVDNFEDVVV